MLSIVATDTDFGSTDFERKLVTAAGIEFTSYEDANDRTPDLIISRLKNADGAITSYGQFTAEVFEALPNLKVVSKTGRALTILMLPPQQRTIQPYAMSPITVQRWCPITRSP